MNVTPLQLLSCELQIEISKLSLQFAAATFEISNRPGGGNPLGKLIDDYLKRAVEISKSEANATD